MVTFSSTSKASNAPHPNNSPLFMVFDSKTLERRSPTRRKPKNLSKEDFENVLHLPQKEASQKLDVCISTLKRQFRKLFPQRRWPTPSERKITHKSHKSKVLRRRLKQLVDVNEDFLAGQSTVLELDSDEEALDAKMDEDVDSPGGGTDSAGSPPSGISADAVFPPQQQTHYCTVSGATFPAQSSTYFPAITPPHPSTYPDWSYQQHYNTSQMEYQYTLLARLLQENCSLQSSIKQQRLFAQSLNSQLKVPQIQLPSSQFQGDIYDIPGPWDTHPDIKDHNTAALFLVDEWLNLVAISQGLCRMTGYTFMDLAPTTHYAALVSRLFRPEYFAILGQRVLESDLSEIVFTDTFVRKDKSLVRVTLNIQKIGKRFFWAIVLPTDTTSSSYLKLNKKEAFSNAVVDFSEAAAAAEHMSVIRGISEQVSLNPSVGAYQEECIY